MVYSLSYDRKGDNDPLFDVIKILWKKDVREIHRYTSTSLEFQLNQNEYAANRIVAEMAQELEKITYFRITRAFNDAIIGEGNLELDENLQEFIRHNVLAGTLKD